MASMNEMNNGEKEMVEVVQVPQHSPVEVQEKSNKNKLEENESSGEDLFVVAKEKDEGQVSDHVTFADNDVALDAILDAGKKTVDENTKRQSDDSDAEELYEKGKTKGNTKTAEGL